MAVVQAPGGATQLRNHRSSLHLKPVKLSAARVQTWLAGLWAGCTLSVGAVAAPSLFAVLSREAGGTRRWPHFCGGSPISLFVAIVLFVLERQRVPQAEERGQRKRLQPCRLNSILVLSRAFPDRCWASRLRCSPLWRPPKLGNPVKLVVRRPCTVFPPVCSG